MPRRARPPHVQRARLRSVHGARGRALTVDGGAGGVRRAVRVVDSLTYRLRPQLRQLPTRRVRLLKRSLPLRSMPLTAPQYALCHAPAGACSTTSPLGQTRSATSGGMRRFNTLTGRQLRCSLGVHLLRALRGKAGLMTSRTTQSPKGGQGEFPSLSGIACVGGALLAQYANEA
jgi:hypothetical protein